MAVAVVAWEYNLPCQLQAHYMCSACAREDVVYSRHLVLLAGFLHNPDVPLIHDTSLSGTRCLKCCRGKGKMIRVPDPSVPL
jgi:hypothetical protein